MSDEDLIRYFIQQTNERLDKIDKHLEDLLAFKWKIVGISLACSAVVSAVIEILFGHGK